MIPDSSAAATPAVREGALRILAITAILALLYLGRDIFVPVTLAVILSLAVAPLVHRLRRFGLSQTFAVLTSVLAVTLVFVAVALTIASQLVRLASNLPQYEATILRKTEVLRDLTINRLKPPVESRSAAPALKVAPLTVPGNPVDIIGKVASSVWVPLETAGTVLVVLIFALLEHDALRDRLIRIAGSSDIRRTTSLINDAGDRLSRFFVSQFLVNLGVGAVLSIGLALGGLPHALLWAAMAAVLRFVPYVGVWIAALFAVVFAAAYDPGWSLVMVTGGLFIAVELLAGQLVEPQLFGHTTGLSPLSVIIAAIFWSWLWGPIGLIVSTPLTLCLLVFGRHMQALDILVVLLGDQPALTMPQRFYQRALSGDSTDIIAAARVFLKRGSFAAYCDVVLMPAMQLARIDFMAGSITKEQQFGVRNTVMEVITALGSRTRPNARRRSRSSVLEIENLGLELRRQRERVSGKYQGPVAVPSGSVTLCIGLGSLADELATEILVRVLRAQGLDARHMSLDELNLPVPEGANPASVALVFVVSAFPGDEREQGAMVTDKMRRRLPNAYYLSLYLPGVLAAADGAGGPSHTDFVDQATTSFRDAEHAGLEWYRNKQGDRMSGPVAPGRIPDGPHEKFDKGADLLTWLGAQFAVYGDIFRASIYGSEVYVLSAPALVRHVLLDNWENYPKGQAIKRIALLLGNGLMVSKGELWKRQRRLIQPAFSRQALRPLAPMIAAANSSLLSKWEAAARAATSVNVTRDVSEMILSVVLRSIFGDDYPRVAPLFNVVADDPVRDLEFAKVFNSLRRHIVEVARQRRAENRRAADFLGFMLEARDRDSGAAMTEVQLAREIMTLIVAGHETTASTLNWTWLLLSDHPAVDATLGRELEAVAHNAFPGPDELPRFKYARNVIEEALRLYPPGWLMTRRAIRDDCIGGYFVPAGTEIYLSPYYIQRNPQLWQAPDAFDPDRYDSRDPPVRDSLAMLPFSAGPRNCVGEQLARMEMQIHLIMIAGRLRLRRTDQAPPRLAAGVNLLSATDVIMAPQLR